MYQLRNILVTTDYSELSAAALAYAQALSVATKARLHLLHVVPVPHEAGAQDAMNAFIDSHVDEYTFFQSAVRFGHPEEEILRYAEDQHVDLIIMATHGRTGLAHVLLGSVAEKIVRHSRIPVMTVKPEELCDPLLRSDDIEQNLHIV